VEAAAALIEKDGGGVGAGGEGLGCRAVPVGEGGKLVYIAPALAVAAQLTFVVVYTTWACVPGI
jgi:hypothetical protein